MTLEDIRSRADRERWIDDALEAISYGAKARADRLIGEKINRGETVSLKEASKIVEEATRYSIDVWRCGELSATYKDAPIVMFDPISGKLDLNPWPVIEEELDRLSVGDFGRPHARKKLVDELLPDLDMLVALYRNLDPFTEIDEAFVLHMKARVRDVVMHAARSI